eukprot:1697549-Pleurochrysis_carterae.AAC.1
MFRLALTRGLASAFQIARAHFPASARRLVPIPQDAHTLVGPAALPHRQNLSRPFARTCRLARVRPPARPFWLTLTRPLTRTCQFACVRSPTRPL